MTSDPPESDVAVLRSKLTHAITQRTEAQRTVAQLREALDDIWGCIGTNQIGDLQRATIEIAVANHIQLWHDEQNGLRG